MRHRHDRAVLADVAPYLRCPHCAADLSLADRVLGCASGHRFDVARQGYVSLLTGDARTGTADTAQMVGAREEFLSSGEYGPLTDAVVRAVVDAVGPGSDSATATEAAPGCVVDAGGGTGHHLAAVLDGCAHRVGICCDLSRYAARRAARAHLRMGAVVADVWRGLPVRDGAAAAVLDVFAPRNAAEFHRMLRPGGALVVATPRPDHLGEVVPRLGLLSVDEDKPRRLREGLADLFTPEGGASCRWRMRLSHRQALALVRMGPSAWHASDIEQRLSALAEPVEVTGAVDVATYRPRH
jgi:23S rRNA (guanine745-N1)-methyltransferase